MADSNEFLKNVEVKVCPRSGFDKSHKNIGTLKVGTITPILMDTVIPNTTGDIKIDMVTQLAPLVSDTFMRCSVKLEAFMVPHRILYGGFEDWFTEKQIAGASTGILSNIALPKLLLESEDGKYLHSLFGPGTLADYLGAHINVPVETNGAFVLPYDELNIFPFLAYHKIYDDWYRNPLVQKPVFQKRAFDGLDGSQDYNYKNLYVSNLPYVASTKPIQYTSNSSAVKFNDGVSIWSLRQRNYGTDYFTGATPTAQFGSPSTIQLSSSNNFSIASLRAANSLQQFRERNNIAGTRLQDRVKAIYGADLSSGVAQRSIYLGSASYNVYSNGVYQTATADSGNPFSGVGAKYGSAYAVGSNFHVKFQADEPAMVFVMATLTPEVNYSDGIDKAMTYFTSSDPRGDLANPLLQNVGQQPIYTDELLSTQNKDYADAGVRTVFGYVDRYADFKVKNNSVHGEMIQQPAAFKTTTMHQFVAQRYLGDLTSQPAISTNFLRINTSDLNDVFVADINTVSKGVAAWYDCFIDYKVVQPLAKYSMPSLQDPAYEHGETKIMRRGGSQLNGLS